MATSVEDKIDSSPVEDKMATPDEEKVATPEEVKMLTLYEDKTPSSYENNEVNNIEGQPNKRRKKKSIVWEHFTIENVSAGCRRACCKQCKQTFAYSTGSKVAGTSHLKRHIAKGTCHDKSQSSPYTPPTRMSGNGSEMPKRRYRTPNLPNIMFDADRCRHEIARMIIMHDYPLHMVEHPGFLAFVQNLQPRFNMVSFNTVQGDCVATYLMEKQNLIKFIDGIPGRFCLTLDMWTSSQSVGFVFITGHFIDSDWKLQKRLLNVVMEPYPDSDTALSHAVAVCLHDWSLENKLFSVTYNQPLSETAFENIRPLLSIKNPLILNGQLCLGNCVARTFSSIAKDVLGAGQDIVKKIRKSVKYVKTSESHEEKFLELKQQLQVPSDRMLFLDDQTKWNTTYQMLVAASELKEVFSCLDTSDPDYKEAPSMEDWKQVETICTYLKLLFDAANILTTTTNPTAIIFFHEVWKIQSELTRAVTSEDPFISSLAKTMQEKIIKYWKDCSLALATAVAMDPRFKMKLVEFSFNKIFGDDAPTYIKIVDDGIHELFHEYVALPLPLTPTYAEDGNAGANNKTDEQGGNLLSDNGLTDFDVYIMETTSQQMKSELDQYLDESLLPRVQEFDVLGWWKLNKLKYPTLSKMARDILSIPVSTVATDAVFDTSIKEMDRYRSSLRPETVEALICAKDWLQYGTSSDVSNAPVRMEY
ncbi:zinc finger BED domain-containing protein DAYSLEEPER [Ziziphus jujuba]|uniref:Zinc finger BED domain-containing protein DAYSLEEPER n=1 Tax=Ziziphus jujuba TaxID=326968 RepID=A0ABM3IRJ0_ZIZJJ|nr:zinc finger BED domain-containing protein DAYSLEEPER [Ziziphus jujuba]XP_048334047.2 zinc finger BED domain-containing protein DAYSLEEPER [Ziziphus jujuba]